jgi:hypothetical protein
LGKKDKKDKKDKNEKKEKRKRKSDVPINGKNKTSSDDNAAPHTEHSSRVVPGKDKTHQKARKTKKDLLEQPTTAAHAPKSKRKDIKLVKVDVEDVEPKTAVALMHTKPESYRLSSKPRIHRIVPWVAMEQSGGRFLSLDPVFSVDEKYDFNHISITNAYSLQIPSSRYPACLAYILHVYFTASAQYARERTTVNCRLRIVLN